MIQKTLANQTIPITDMLPHGAINDIAKELGLNRVTISKILKGAEGYAEETINKVVTAAINIIDSDLEKRTAFAENMKQLREMIAV